jgi:hypothetical protein
LEYTAWNIPLGIYRLEYTAWNIPLGICRLEYAAWNMPLGIYCLEYTALNILLGIYCLEGYHVDRKIVLKEINIENVRDLDLFCSGLGAVM